MRKPSLSHKSSGALLIGFVSIWLLLAGNASAESPPKGVLALRQGGYAYADYPGVFDDIGVEGITIEVWFYLTAIPSEWRELWVLVEKTDSYSLGIRGRQSTPPFLDPPGTIHLRGRIVAQRGNNTGGSSTHTSFDPGDPPLERWIHVAWQLSREGITNKAFFIDGESGPGGKTTVEVKPSPGPLFIGGKESGERIRGWIDEVRISNLWRYSPGKMFTPKERFRNDQHTIALWHFDEGPWARQYEDSSGNGYTLFSGGTLPVDRRKELATAWGRFRDIER
ncbi:LamG-like jellyroll fold domain-containing protein [Candidatus Poribacteria bacterium]